MDIQVARFREVLDLLKPTVARKPKIKSLGYVMLKDGQAIATNLETMVVHSVPEADLTTLVPIAEVIKVLKFTPGREMLKVESKKNKLSLSWVDGSASFPVEDPDTFPEVPDFVPECEELLDVDTLIPAMVMVLPYASAEESRPILNGITLVLGNPVEVAAGDGFRMADKVLTLSYPKNITTILPRSSVSVLQHLLKNTPRTPPPSDELIPIIISKKKAMVAHDGKQGLRFQFDKNTSAIVKLVQGNPPDWLKLIPKEDPIVRVQVLAADLELSVRRIMGVAQAGKDMVILSFEEEKVIVSAKGDGQEIRSSFKPYAIEGGPHKIGLNVSYLLGYLNGKEGIVTISWTGKEAPVALQSLNEPRVLIMPMTL